MEARIENELLTEKLKVIETEIFDLKCDMKAIAAKLDIAYSYETELNQRIVSARKKTNELQKLFFTASNKLTNKFNEVKKIVNVWTGNFYTDVNPKS